MRGVRVSLSSGDVFYVADESLEDVAAALNVRGLRRFGNRFVNGLHVAQLTVDQIPSIESPEELPRLKEVA